MTQTESVVRTVRWADYEEPELLPLQRSGRAVLLVRAAMAGSAISIVIAAALLRASIDEDAASTTTVSTLGLVGVCVAIGSAILGWHWTDRAIRDVHRLGRRLPTRLRCVSAWAWPIVWSILLSWTLLQLSPTDPVDVRPAMVAVVIALALWRPYSLVRRILRSLIRIDSDLAVFSGYVLDLGLVGLMWSQLGGLPDEVGPTDAGAVGVLVGLSAVAAIAALGNLGVWYVLVRDVDRALEHCRVANRTRHQHRQLRLVGIDPLDPQVRLALLRIQHLSHEAEQQRDEESGVDDSVVTADDSGTLAVDAPAVGTSLRATDSRTPPDGDEHREPPPQGRFASQDSDDSAPTVTDELDADVPATEVGRHRKNRADESKSTAPRHVHDAGASVDDGETVDGNGDDAEVDERAAGPAVATSGSFVRRAARPELDVERARPKPDDGTGADRDAIADRLRSRLSARQGRGGEGAQADPIERIRDRLTDESPGESDRSILERLERLGITPGGQEVLLTVGGLDGEDEERTVAAQNLYSLELIRYILILANAACAVASVWFVLRSVDAGELVGGEIAPAGLDRLEVARLAIVRSLAVALALVPAWCATAAYWSNRADHAAPGVARCSALFVVSTVLVVSGFLADAGSAVTTLSLIGCLAAAAWSVPIVVGIARSLGLDTTIPTLLPVAMGSCVLTSWLGGVLTPVGSTDSLEAMSFSGGSLALTAAIATVVTAVATGALVDGLRPSLASRRPSHRRVDHEDVAAR